MSGKDRFLQYRDSERRERRRREIERQRALHPSAPPEVIPETPDGQGGGRVYTDVLPQPVTLALDADGEPDLDRLDLN